MERLKTGVAGLDVMLKGGLPKGRSILVTGHCGTGKTMLGLHFIDRGVHEQQNGVYITFDQSKDKLISDAKQINIDLEAMEKHGKLSIIGGSFGSLRFYKDKSQAKISDLIDEIKEVIEETNAKRVVVDSVNLFTMLFDKESEKRLGMGALIHTLEELGCTAILTCEVPEDSKRFGWYGFEEFMVDGVLFMQRKPFDGYTERSIAIVKMRGSAHMSGVRAMDIQNRGVVVYANHEPGSTRVSSHTEGY